MAHKAIDDHLVGLLIDHIAHLRARSVRWLSYWHLVRILHLGPVLDKMCLNIVLVVYGVRLAMLFEEIFHLWYVGSRILAAVVDSNFPPAGWMDPRRRMRLQASPERG